VNTRQFDVAPTPQPRNPATPQPRNPATPQPRNPPTTTPAPPHPHPTTTTPTFPTRYPVNCATGYPYICKIRANDYPCNPPPAPMPPPPAPPSPPIPPLKASCGCRRAHHRRRPDLRAAGGCAHWAQLLTHRHAAPHLPGAPAANTTFFCESPYLGRETQLKCYQSFTSANGAAFFAANTECQKSGGVLVQYER
jgi:hypothetical protein